MFIDIVTVASFFGICLFVFLAGNMISRARQRAWKIEDVAVRVSVPPPGQLKRAMAGSLPQLKGEVANIEQDLKRAGYYQPFAMVDFMATRSTLVYFSMILTGIICVLAEPGSEFLRIVFFVGAITTILAYGLPRLLLGIQARNRVERIQRGLPAALDIIRMCLTGGLPLREALDRVAKEVEFFHPDIAVELEVIRRHSDADTMSKALKQFASRIDTPDVKALSSLVSQTDRIGTHVAVAVAEFADSLRRSRRQRAEEQASKTSIKMLFPVVLCLAPAVFLLLLGPPFLKLRDFMNEGNQPGGILDTPNLDVMENDR